ncbi:MAG: 16S rRNA (cytidine(1402)-2'-O)-methyltransferase [Chloroflexota bacterium]
MGTLYVVGTPIGNLEDMTFRAVRVLREVNLIAAEDTRTSRVLLKHYEIETPTTSFHAFTGSGKVLRLVERLEDGDVAIISDAGTPGISDPGYPLIRAAIDAGYPVIPIPGPSAVIAALVASGIPMHAFTFLGFLPRKSGQRRSLLAAHASLDHALLAFESPHRLRAALTDIAAELGDRPMVAARELTKKFEESVRGSVSTVLEHFTAHEPRGEFTLVIAGAGQGPVLE